VVRLVTRPPNVEGVGQVTLRDLVRQALRMRPDRLVVGEVRGAEVSDLLAALNTGHDGGCGTLHANRPSEVPARLEALGGAAGLDRAAVHSQAAAALSVVVHLRRTGLGRQVAELGVLRRAGDVVVVEAGWRADGGPCPAADRLGELLDEDVG
jgi:pilus assembly protein CpaF